MTSRQRVPADWHPCRGEEEGGRGRGDTLGVSAPTNRYLNSLAPRLRSETRCQRRIRLKWLKHCQALCTLRVWALRTCGFLPIHHVPLVHALRRWRRSRTTVMELLIITVARAALPLWWKSAQWQGRPACSAETENWPQYVQFDTEMSQMWSCSVCVFSGTILSSCLFVSFATQLVWLHMYSHSISGKNKYYIITLATNNINRKGCWVCLHVLSWRNKWL